MKTHEKPKPNGSIRMHNHLNNKNNAVVNKNNNSNPLPQQVSANNLQNNPRLSIEIEDCNVVLEKEIEENLICQRIDDLKFIDTTSYCETPKLLRHQNVHASIENINLQSPSTVIESSLIIPTTIISLESEAEEPQLNPINGECALNMVRTKVTHDMGVDSAVEESTVSLEQVMTQIMILNYFLLCVYNIEMNTNIVIKINTQQNSLISGKRIKINTKFFNVFQHNRIIKPNTCFHFLSHRVAHQELSYHTM